MKQIAIVGALMILGIASLGSRAATRSYTGEIMDSDCAKMGNHDAGYKMTSTNTPKDCTVACVKAGSKYVLYNPSNKITYELDDQQKAEQFAGQKVRVFGALNVSTQTLHVDKIEPGS